ncbi:MAG: ECF transporter S component [Candidatus Dormibacteraeota bacterium]|nr:ECF transporter S component [Candidatus Dormibacteraeota bacterium]
MILVLLSMLGMGLFLWPFSGLGLPATTPALVIGLGTALGLLIFEVGTRRMDSRSFALLAALSAADAALRAALVTGIGGFSPIFLLVLCGGYALGPEFGFLVGAGSLLTSALATGGLGPWIPYQLFALGWVGMVAGLAGSWRRGRRPGAVDVVILAAVGVVTGFGFGAVMDVWNWTFFAGSPQLGWSPRLAPLTALARFARYYALTSFVYDSFRAWGNAAMVALLGLPILVGLRRVSRRFTLAWAPAEDASVLAAHDQATGDLVMPGLAARVGGGPEEPDRAGRQVQ